MNAFLNFQAIMEEISSFEERLTSLKQKGEGLVASCTDQVQAKISQQVQAHQQGARDSYSAICSTAQRVSSTSQQPYAYSIFINIESKLSSSSFHLRVLLCLICSTGLPESRPGAAETRQSSGHSPAVPNLALHCAGGAQAQ